VTRTLIMLALMASFALFPLVLKIYEKRYRRFRAKEVLQRHINSKICYRYGKLVIGPRVVQFRE